MGDLILFIYCSVQNKKEDTTGCCVVCTDSVGCGYGGKDGGWTGNMQ